MLDDKWGKSEVITEETNRILETALSGLLGVKYKGVTVSKMINNEEYYGFLCNATRMGAEEGVFSAWVCVWQVPGKEPGIISIDSIHY